MTLTRRCRGNSFGVRTLQKSRAARRAEVERSLSDLGDAAASASRARGNCRCRFGSGGVRAGGRSEIAETHHQTDQEHGGQYQE